MTSRGSALAGSMLLALGIAAAGAGPAAADGGGRFEYEVWAGGVRVLEADLVMRTNGERYRMDLEAVLVGPPSWVDDYKLVSFSEGVLGEAGPQPVFYRHENSSYDDDDDMQRWVQLAYNSGMPMLEADHKLFDENRHPIYDYQKQDSFDPLSGLLSLILQTASQGRCDGVAEIFDGRRRFDLTLSDLGEGEMMQSRYNAYDGPTRRCAVELDAVAGYLVSGRDSDQFPDEVVLQAAQVIEGLPPVPVRLDTEVSYGVVILHLVDYQEIDPNWD